MKSFWLALPLLLIVWGCSDKEKQELTEKGRETVSSVRDQVTSSITQFSKDAKTEVLRAARAKAIEIQGQLSDVKVPTELQKLQLNAVNAQIGQIDAMLEERSLMDRLGDAQKQMAATKANAEKGVKDAQASLAKAEATLKDINLKLEQARTTYDDATKRLENLKNQLQSFTGG